MSPTLPVEPHEPTRNTLVRVQCAYPIEGRPGEWACVRTMQDRAYCGLCKTGGWPMDPPSDVDHVEPTFDALLAEFNKLVHRVERLEARMLKVRESPL